MKARLPQGMGGGAGNMQNMIRQAQKMQEAMEKTQEELNAKEYTVAAAGGMVECVINGKREILSVNIKPEAVDPDDVEMLQDMIKALINEAIAKVDAINSAEMEKVTGGLNLPGVF
jgi:DNA-binding YbaB/EbfC family protein